MIHVSEVGWSYSFGTVFSLAFSHLDTSGQHPALECFLSLPILENLMFSDISYSDTIASVGTLCDVERTVSLMTLAVVAGFSARGIARVGYAIVCDDLQNSRDLKSSIERSNLLAYILIADLEIYSFRSPWAFALHIRLQLIYLTWN